MSKTGSKGKGARPLGSLRHSISTTDKIPHIPRLVNSADTKIDKLDEKYQGIQGNAMTVPPTSTKETARESSTEREKGKTTTRSTGSPVVNKDLVDRKELKDALAREKELKLVIANLEKLIEELRALLAQRECEILALQETLKTKEKEHKSALDAEKKKHSKTQVVLEETRAELETARDQVDEMRQEMEKKLNEQRADLERSHAQVLSEKDKEIAIRDEKLNRLKQQMADALKGNSWERQQQLEELTKELARIQDEADLLRMKLKAFSKNKAGSCSNCPDLMAKLDRAHLTVKDREHSIRDLKSHIGKLDTQLTKQDQLLKMWAESKGYPDKKKK